MKAKSILLLVTLFLAGGVVGAFITGRVYKNRVHRIKEQRKPEVFMKHMHDMLELNTAQQKSIDSVMHLYLPRIKETRKHHHEQVRSLHDTMLTEIRSYLNDGQLQKLDQFEGRLFHHRHHDHHRPHGEHRERH